MDKYDIIIIGAGISGLSLAHYCAKEGINALVIEKGDRIGGALHSHSFDGNFWLELGSHTCYNSYRNLIEIVEDCHILDKIMKREKVSFKMLIDNQIKSIPSQLNFPELLFSAPQLFVLKKYGLSIESYYSKIVGRKNFERVFAPAFNAVISQNANDFPADMLFKKRERRKDIIKKFTFCDGTQTIANAIAAEKNIRILTNMEVNVIKFDNNLFSITTAEGTCFESPALALAAPASIASQLLKDVFPEISGRLSKIKVETIESTGIVIKKDAISLNPFAGIFPRNNGFFSIVSRDTVRHDDYRGFTFHFKPGLMDREAKLNRIGKVLGVKQRQFDYVVSKNNSVPSLRVGHDRLITEIDMLIAGKRLLLTGNYFNGLAIEDCVSRSLSEFSRLKVCG
ncbi:MAG: FAD-dependent oxidoreductase [Nitrospirae bacterium]|nr:FAD-dependent oxidoreductase [Nitrospirota bacterium]